MIDEEWLAAALRDLSATIEAPSDGPARILAARGPLAPRPPRRTAEQESSIPSRRRRVAVFAVVVGSVAALVVAFALTRPSTGGVVAHSALKSLAPPAASTTVPAPVVQLPPLSSSQGSVKATGGSTGSSPATPAPPATPSPAATGPTVPAVSTKVIKTGTVDLQVGRGKLSPAVDQLTSLASGLGGYVSQATTSEVGPAPTADMTLRVPVDQFETLLVRARALGTPTEVTTSGQDVTSAYVDLNAQIQALEATQTQYLQILAKATTIGDILSVEQQLSGVQSQLQQLQGQQMVLADQTSFGTLTVNVTEQGSGTSLSPPSGFAKAWEQARSSFTHGLEAVIGASGGVLVFLLVAGLVLLAARLTWPAIRRRLV